MKDIYKNAFLRTPEGKWILRVDTTRTYWGKIQAQIYKDVEPEIAKLLEYVYDQENRRQREELSQ